MWPISFIYLQLFLVYREIIYLSRTKTLRDDKLWSYRIRLIDVYLGVLKGYILRRDCFDKVLMG